MDKLTGENPWKELVKLDFDCNEFTSPKTGVTYYVNRNVEELSLKRYELFEKMLIELNFSMTWEDLLRQHNKLGNYIRQADNYMSSVQHHNITTGITDLESKGIISWWLATVYIARKGEDVTNWDEVIAKEKIADWKSVYDASFFLQLKDTMSGRLTELCEHISQTFSELPTNLTYSLERTEELKNKYEINPNSD